MIADSDGCRFRVLGPVEVLAHGKPLRFARRQQLDLIAFLMLRADRVVGTDEIVEAMWGRAAPRTANVQVQNMMSALRAVLHDGSAPLARVDRRAAGYVLHITDGHLDLAVFTSLVGQARSAPTPAAAVGLLRAALELWRGPQPLAGVRAAFATAARASLSEQRDRALEQLFDAELSCGNHAAIVPDLTAAVAANPVRQRFVAQLMSALHGSGRTTDALGAYRSARQTLHGEYGLDVGRELQELERRILRGDRTLDPPTDRAVPGLIGWPPEAPPSEAPPPVVPVPAQLPLDVRGFAGRAAELARLDALAPTGEAAVPVVVAVVMGTAGVGKTALAVHWAQRVAGQFPDGQLYVNLRGFHPGGMPVEPAEALRGFLDAFGVAPDRIPATVEGQAALFRSLVAGRRILLLLDNALDADQVRPLLPGGHGGMVLITSRHQLIGLVALENAHPVTLDVLTEHEARELLIGRLGADRVGADLAAADAIAVQCARLPLALAMVAARAAVQPTLLLGSLSAELSAVRERLRSQDTNDLGTDVRAAFSRSYRRWTPAAAAPVRLLGLHPGPDAGVDAAASLAGVPVDRVRPRLTELVRAHLITEPVPDRFCLHDLLRAYAADLAQHGDQQPDRQAALRRVLSHYLHSAYAAAILHRYQLGLVPVEAGAVVTGFADASQASAWFTAEHLVLLAALNLAAEADLGRYAWQLASAMSTALAAAKRGADRTGQAHAHGSLGLAYNRLNRYDEALVHLHRADGLFGELEDLAGQAYTNLRLSLVHEGHGQPSAVLLDAQQALDRFSLANHRIGQGRALNSIGRLHAHLGQSGDAVPG